MSSSAGGGPSDPPYGPTDAPRHPQAAPAATPEPWMKRYCKPLVVLATLLAALSLTVYRSGRQGLVGLQLGTDRPSRAESTETNQKPYDLARLRILNMTLQRIRDNYVDPTRID